MDTSGLPDYMQKLIQDGSPKNQLSKADIVFTKPSLEAKTFRLKVNNEEIILHVMKLKDSLFLWVAKESNMTFEDLSLAMMDSFEKVISTKILGAPLDSASTNLATRLSKKLGKPVYVSLNMSLDLLSLPWLERSICETMASNKESF